MRTVVLNKLLSMAITHMYVRLDDLKEETQRDSSLELIAERLDAVDNLWISLTNCVSANDFEDLAEGIYEEELKIEQLLKDAAGWMV